MKWLLLISAVALAGPLGVCASSPQTPKAKPADAAADRADTSGGVVTLPSVGSGSEAVGGVVVKLPAPPAPAAIAAPEPGPPKAADGTLPQIPPIPAAGEGRPPVIRRAKRVYPAEFEHDSALFCQTKIDEWTEADARELLGEASRERITLGEDQSETGRIVAFADPTGRYKELELDFANQTGILRSVFAYPWKMTWPECRRLWGAKVTASKTNKGRTFYSYLNRRLDVLVDPAGKVISLGLY